MPGVVVGFLGQQPQRAAPGGGLGLGVEQQLFELRPEVFVACPARFALVLRDYRHFQARHKHLGPQLQQVLLDAQAEAAARGRALWLLAEEPDHDTRHW